MIDQERLKIMIPSVTFHSYSIYEDDLKHQIRRG